MGSIKIKAKSLKSEISVLIACLAFASTAHGVSNPLDIPAPPSDTANSGINTNWVHENGNWKYKNIEYCARQDAAGNPVTGPTGTLHVPSDFSPEKRYPVVVFFHGAYAHENENFPNTVLSNLAKEGFIGFSAGYQNVSNIEAAINPTKQVRQDFIQSAADGRCAIRWVKELASNVDSHTFNIDPDNIAVAGWSWGTMVAQNIALAPTEKVDVCINGAINSVETVSSWRIFLHRALKHNITVSDSPICSFELSESQWNKVENMIGATEAQWNHWDESVQAFVPISTTSDLLNISTECALMHSDFGSAGNPLLPLPVASNGESPCQRYKSVQRAHQIMLPHTEQLPLLTNGDYFEQSWRDIASSMMWQDATDKATPFHLDRDGNAIPSGSETIVPYEHYMVPSTRQWIEKNSPIDALPPVTGEEHDAIVAKLGAVNPIPTLIIGGANDPATVWWEPVSLGVRLHAASFPVETVIFDGAGHGLKGVEQERDSILISGFLKRVFGDLDEDALTWVASICNSHMVGESATIDCMSDLTTLSRPFVFPISTASHVTYPHHWEEDARVAPLDSLGIRVPQGGVYTLYDKMSYEFGGLDFAKTETGYDNYSQTIEWSLSGGLDTIEMTEPANNRTCIGSKLVVTTRANLESKYKDSCYFKLEPGEQYTLTVTGNTEQYTTTLDVKNHPLGGVGNLRIEKHSAFWGLVKWHVVRWGDYTGYEFPGGRVNIYIDGAANAVSFASQTSVTSFYGNRAKSKYKLCYTGTEVCTIKYVY